MGADHATKNELPGRVSTPCDIASEQGRAKTKSAKAPLTPPRYMRQLVPRASTPPPLRPEQKKTPHKQRSYLWPEGSGASGRAEGGGAEGAVAVTPDLALHRMGAYPVAVGSGGSGLVLVGSAVELEEPELRVVDELLLGVWLDSHVCQRPNPAHIRWQLTAAVVVTLFTLAFDVRAAQVRMCSAQPIVNAATHENRPEVCVACLEWTAPYCVHRATVAGHHPSAARQRWHTFARTPVCGGCFAESSPCMCAVANAINVVLRGP